MDNSAIKRLFDIPRFQLQYYPNEDALAAKEKDVWSKYTTAEFVENVNKVSRALLAFGIQKDDKVAIIANNRPEWNYVDLGVAQIGAINVPIYPTISEDDYKFIFNDAEIKLAFVSDEDLFKKLTNIKPQVSTLQEIYTFDSVIGAKHFTDFIGLASQKEQSVVDEIMQTIDARDLATIIYTSGTTGTPKGVMLSHDNVASNVRACMKILPINSNHRAFSFLPLNHVFERMVTYAYMALGVSIYYAESMETIGENLKEVKPNLFTTVPRLLEKVYDKIYNKGLEQTGIKKKLFFWALDLGLEYDTEGKGLWYKIKLAIANKLIFSKWREALGGNIIAIISGGAALQERLARVFTAGQIPVLQGYGLTETSPVIGVNLLSKGGNKFGTIGPVISGVDVKIAEDGEILCKGPNVMMGYYKRQDLTDEVIDKDGWFHTGDIGEFVDGKFLKITDRKKELIKTSGGKYCAPQPIENKYKESPLIEQIMVVGEGQKFIAGIIMPATEALQEWCEKNGITWTDKHTIIKNDKVLAEFDKIRDEFNITFSQVEQLKKIVLVADEWTVESGDLTPTMKIKRKVITEKYKDVINDLYN